MLTSYIVSLSAEVVEGGQGSGDSVANCSAKLAGGLSPGIAAGVNARNGSPHVDIGANVATGVKLQ